MNVLRKIKQQLYYISWREQRRMTELEWTKRRCVMLAMVTTNDL